MVQKIKKTSQPQEPRKQTEHHVKEQQSKSAVPVIPIATPSAASIPGKNHRVSLTDKQGFVGTKREPKKSSDKIEFAPVEERIDLWGEDEDEEENQTINEGDYPSSTLFDEVDDTELFELGEDGILREIPSSHDRDQGRRSRHRSQPYDDQVYMDDEDEDNDQEEEERHDQVWMVDEWEEELEGDMDEVMNWAEEDGILNSRLQELRKVKNKKPPSAMIMGADHLRDQDSSAIRNALMDEDEASPFRHLLSDSWLF
ncbi:hypothetical protein EDD11_008797 [Mortierella claussenii]|nr:hypothetical protein EDD11_008797 [Mortierella claussenii]